MDAQFAENHIAFFFMYGQIYLIKLDCIQERK